ncbi:putative quinol monooxygenase [Candidatus Marinarcus aquaticus]|uniref:Antibiotic biosynthesis monooxygenase n=1 Tax=Candidatus Marinarcus aquaticus TaxID=2044504 RepID=A0A4Q0XTC4_9BACT|nr:antibiotic biosynthesis monooxygenase [Candidatus Marinarcus aquaticus]RXJ58036.1 antibiotic biosynthesis monooxygenase [Candidatus Marinarcus aquaticus]
MSKKIYCIASFKPKKGKFNELFRTLQALEPQTQREDGCIQYLVTKHISHPNAQGESFPIVFNEIWASKEDFEAHCAKEYITTFFQKECIDENGLVEAFNVCTYSDE